MNRLKSDKEILVLKMLTEGNSIRGTARMTGIDKNTVLRVLKRAGSRCSAYLDEYMVGLHCDSLEADEIWTYIAKKKRLLNRKERLAGEFGDQFIFVALDSKTKLVPVYLVAKRTTASACKFLCELRKRVVNTPQLTTDQFSGYKTAVPYAFGQQVHYATLRKSYSGNKDGREGYSPPKLRKVYIKDFIGNPNPRKVCTSYVERQNLTMRMNMRRFTRLTNGFSKKVDNLEHAVALHFMYYNFVRIHKTLRVTPAMEAGVTDRLWSLENIVELVENREK